MNSPSNLDKPRDSHENPDTSDEGTIIDSEEDGLDKEVPLAKEWKEAWEKFFDRKRKRQSNEKSDVSPL